MPWNEPGKDKDPWGQRNNDGPPDLDELFKNMKDKFGGNENEPIETALLFEYFTQARDRAMDEFNIIGEIRDKYSNYPDFVDKLQNYINEQEDSIIDINENLAKE